MAKFMKPALVEAAIAAQGTQFFTIAFEKKNGEIAKKNVRARMTSRRVGGERGEKQAQVLKDNGMIFLDYPQKDARGCSVRKTHVVSIVGQGAVITPQA